MQRLASAFRDVHGLHARIGTYFNQSSVLKIGIVPLNGRVRSAPLLTALTSEPVQRTVWSDALANRPLTKDVLVTQSGEFSYTETQNSLVVFPVPFPGPPVEYLEVNSLTDSFDHLKTCHLLLILSDNEQQLASFGDPHFPWLRVLDAKRNYVGSAPNAEKPKFEGETVRVDSALALKANALLQKSASNISEFLCARKQSNIPALQHFDRVSVYKALKSAIFRTCAQQIDAMPQPNLTETKDRASSRQKWVNDAHHELQSTLMPQLRHLLTKDLAFYKLYLRSDDVQSVLITFFGQAMPQARAQFQFLRGRASSATNSNQLTIDNPDFAALEVAQLVENLASHSLTAVIRALSVQLPICGVALASSLFLDFSLYSTAALALLGFVVGLRQLQTRWLKLTQKFASQVLQVFTNQIRQRERQLWECGEQTASEMISRRAHLESVLASAKQKK